MELKKILTLEPITLLACTHMLYSAEATVLVLTDPAFRLVMATMIACTYGAPTRSVLSAHFTHGPVPVEIVSNAIRIGSAQTWLTRPVRKRWFVFSDTQVQKSSPAMKST